MGKLWNQTQSNNFWQSSKSTCGSAGAVRGEGGLIFPLGGNDTKEPKIYQKTALKCFQSLENEHEYFFKWRGIELNDIGWSS